MLRQGLIMSASTRLCNPASRLIALVSALLGGVRIISCHGYRTTAPPRRPLLVPSRRSWAQRAPLRHQYHRLDDGDRQAYSPISLQRPRNIRVCSVLCNMVGADGADGCVSKDGDSEDDNATLGESPYLMDEHGRPCGVRDGTSLGALQTPHSGRHFRPTHPKYTSGGRLRSKLRSVLRPFTGKRTGAEAPSRTPNAKRTFFSRRNRRFTEGWYYRLTLPEYNESFVFVFSIEDAGRRVRGKKSPLTLACMQLLGPDDTYLVQSDENDAKFWGWKRAQALGCTFEWKEGFAEGAKESGGDAREIAAMTPEEWREAVSSGFQILPFHLQGRLDGHDGTFGGVRANQGRPGTAEYDMTIRPVAGWGDYPPLSSPGGRPDGTERYRQRSTAGWLASFPVFEPHWQITMAHARASGTVNWNGTTYSFEDAPFYGEKNWGGAFPTKWYWAQCNSFDDHPDLSFTAGGGIRQLPFSFLPGKRTETLGLIGIHYEGRFYEIVPWTGEMEWSVWPWGRWEFRGRCTDKRGEIQFEAEVVAVTDADIMGVLLRAPTKDEGMQYFCRDSGFGQVVLSLWELEWDNETGDFVRSPNKKPLLDSACSSQCTVEVGGGPWWDVWRVNSKMSNTLKQLIRLPLIMRKA
ncbi:hypothetical protein ACHAWF_011318 [Thalassiosira exigua]